MTKHSVTTNKVATASTKDASASLVVTRSLTTRLLNSLTDQWFLVSILILIPLGITQGPLLLKTPGINSCLAFFNSQVMTFGVLFLMSWTLDVTRFKRAFTTPLPIILALVIGYLLLPLLGKLTTFLPLPIDLGWGILIVCCVPTTMATAAVYARQAGGNDAISLVTTLISNFICPFVTPFLLLLLSGKSSSLNQQELITSLLIIALLPTILGQLLRYPQVLAGLADKYKTRWSMLAQCGILYMIFRTIVTQATLLKEQFNLNIFNQLLIVWISCLLIHVVGLFAGYALGRICLISRENIIAIIFSGSQKTLPVGVYIASTFAMNAGLIVLPIIMFHVTQLVVDTWVIGLCRRSSHASPSTST